MFVSVRLHIQLYGKFLMGSTMDMHDPTKTAMDGLSIATVVGTLAGLLPAIAALVTIIWTGIRIFETNTVRGWLGKRQAKADE